MLTKIWEFLADENNRSLLGWIGGGLVVVVGALWAVFIQYTRKPERDSVVPSASADHGGVAVGRDLRDSEVNTADKPKKR